MAHPPQWAQDLVIRVALDEGCEILPELTWRRSRQALLSSGRASPPNHAEIKPSGGRWLPQKGRYKRLLNGRVVITAGKDRRDQKLVLLHELAHWLSAVYEHHGPTFWDKAWQLYRRYGVPILYAKQREGTYRKGALAAYCRQRRKE